MFAGQRTFRLCDVSDRTSEPLASRRHGLLSKRPRFEFLQDVIGTLLLEKRQHQAMDKFITAGVTGRVEGSTLHPSS